MTEIERSFLVAHDPPAWGDVTHIDQGYLAVDRDGTEVRLRRRGGELTLTVKGGGAGSTRAEEELTLGADRFERLWPLTEGRRLEKDRHVIRLPGSVSAELDLYHGPLEGLRVVEVEFDSERDAADFEPPAWFGPEVTDDPRYRNRELAVHGRPHD
jgi:adenylate cyclase